MDIGAISKKNDKWEHPQFTIEIIQKYPDRAYKTLRFTSNDLPGLIAVEPKLEVVYRHRFHFTIPREYPQNLGNIKIVTETPLYHPRMGAVGANACYTVNGEVDRIFVDLIYNVLLRPETVRPPTRFKDADWGLNAQKMQWYIHYGPERIYEYLKQEWTKRQSKTKPKKKGHRVQILDG